MLSGRQHRLVAGVVGEQLVARARREGGAQPSPAAVDVQAVDRAVVEHEDLPGLWTVVGKVEARPAPPVGPEVAIPPIAVQQALRSRQVQVHLPVAQRGQSRGLDPLQSPVEHELVHVNVPAVGHQ